eukprot:jgi/Bigna1/68723/fgenesh1_pg.7_\
MPSSRPLPLVYFTIAIFFATATVLLISNNDIGSALGLSAIRSEIKAHAWKGTHVCKTVKTQKFGSLYRLADYARLNRLKAKQYDTEEERLKNFVLPEGEERLKSDLRATAEERIRDVIGELKEETDGDILTPEGFQKLRERIKQESKELLNRSFDEAKTNLRNEFNEKLDAIEEQRRDQRQKNLEWIEKQKLKDDEELDRLYREKIEPLKKDREEIQELVEELREEQESASRNVGLFFQNLYGPNSTPRKDKAVRPQSVETGKLKFLEENASDPKELGKATRTAIEDLQTQAEEQALPFKRGAYSIVAAVILING